MVTRDSLLDFLLADVTNGIAPLTAEQGRRILDLVDFVFPPGEPTTAPPEKEGAPVQHIRVDHYHHEEPREPVNFAWTEVRRMMKERDELAKMLDAAAQESAQMRSLRTEALDEARDVREKYEHTCAALRDLESQPRLKMSREELASRVQIIYELCPDLERAKYYERCLFDELYGPETPAPKKEDVKPEGHPEDMR